MAMYGCLRRSPSAVITRVVGSASSLLLPNQHAHLRNEGILNSPILGEKLLQVLHIGGPRDVANIAAEDHQQSDRSLQGIDDTHQIAGTKLEELECRQRHGA